MKAKKREQEFCTQLVNGIKAAGGFAHKISDVPVSFMKAETGKRIRFTLPKKFDIHCANPLRRGQYTAIEAKMWTLKSYPTPARVMKMLRPSEFESLREVHAAKGCSLVAIKRYVPRASEYWLLSASLFFEHYGQFPDLIFVDTYKDILQLITHIICPWPGDKDKGDD